MNKEDINLDVLEKDLEAISNFMMEQDYNSACFCLGILVSKIYQKRKMLEKEFPQGSR